MKSRWIIVMLLVGIGLLAGAGAALAQDEPPPPYEGLTNPFALDDADAIAAGQTIYTQKCRACHGDNGDKITPFDFSSDAFHDELQSEADRIYYIVSEGNLSNGMPGYKAQLSDDERWQVVTYMNAIGTPAAIPTPTGTPTTTPTTTPTGPPATYNIEIILPPGNLATGSEVLINAFVTDENGDPVAGAPVDFSLSQTFQGTSGELHIGQAVTDETGQAVLDHTPRIAGDTTLTVSYSGSSVQQGLTIADSGEVFYRADIGLHFPAAGSEVYIGGESSKQIDAEGNAPSSALRLPGGLLSWLWLYILIVAVVWVAYIVIMYQVVGIAREGGPGAKVVPIGALLLVILMAVAVILMIMTGPYSQFHV